MELVDSREPDDKFAPNELELEEWSLEVKRSREEYYLNPGPHLINLDPVSFAPPWVQPGPTRKVLEQALDDLWMERHRAERQQRLISALYKRVVELEIKAGERDGKSSTLQSVPEEGQDDRATRDGSVQPALRGQSDRRDRWTA